MALLWLVAATVCWVTATVAVGGAGSSHRVSGNRRAWPREMDDNPPVEARRSFDSIPQDIRRIGDGDIHRLRKVFEIVVIAVVHPYVCPKCDMLLDAFQSIRKELHFDDSGHADHVSATSCNASSGAVGIEAQGHHVKRRVVFGFLDAEEEAPEFISYVPGLHEENYRMQVPMLLIFRGAGSCSGGALPSSRLSSVLRLPPIIFRPITEGRIRQRLPAFLMRLLGDQPIAVVRTERDLMLRVASRFTNGVSIGVWVDEMPQSLVKVAEASREDVFWHHLPNAGLRQHVKEPLNPQGFDVVAYWYRGPSGIEEVRVAANTSTLIMDGFRLEDVRRGAEPGSRRAADRERAAMKKLLETYLAHRPGQRFEKITQPIVVEDHAPTGCRSKGMPQIDQELRRARAGDRVRLRVSIYDAFSAPDARDAEVNDIDVVVGEEHRSLPFVVVSDGVEGACVGSKRRVGLPAADRFGGGPPSQLSSGGGAVGGTEGLQFSGLPHSPTVADTPPMVFDVEVLSFSSTTTKYEHEDVGGRNDGTMKGDATAYEAQYPPPDL